MKAKGWLLVIGLAGFAAASFAGDFTATVDSGDIAAEEGIRLHLALQNATAKGRPDFSPLEKDFTIASQSESSNIMITNGGIQRNVGWELTLLPKSGGKLEIPALSIETSAGTQSSDPIPLEVGQEAAAARPDEAPGDHRAVSISAQADNLTPYKGQTVVYTVRIKARGELADLSLQDLAIEGAAIEKQGEPKISDAIENGEPIKIIEVRYLVTPLKSGEVDIPRAVLTGKRMFAMSLPRRDPFGQDLDDPFGMMRRMDAFPDLAQPRPFRISSDPVALSVKPEAGGVTPWLPLTALSLKEEWDDTAQATVGQPLTRKITLSAGGTGGKQLPDLEPQQDHDDFTVYADKPAISETVGEGGISGKRIESFSLIPKHAGKIKVPAIKIAWWNVATNRAETAELPARTIEVAPGAPSPAGAPAPAVVPHAPAAMPSSAAPAAAMSISPVVLGLIGLLLLALIGLAVWVARLRGKLSASAAIGSAIPEVTAETKRAPGLAKTDVANVAGAPELAAFLRRYARDHSACPENVSIEQALTAIGAHSAEAGALAEAIGAELSAHLYAGRTCDLERLKTQSRQLLALAHADRPKAGPTERLSTLNPN